MSSPTFVRRSCILSKFYIKPQQHEARKKAANGCILSKFYIKPQLRCTNNLFRKGCILSKFYIKPQLITQATAALKVVSYRNSTSNHNCTLLLRFFRWLYLIEILHQTTTCNIPLYPLLGCILSKFYIKPQLSRPHVRRRRRCILSKFYIKPQRRG